MMKKSTQWEFLLFDPVVIMICNLLPETFLKIATFPKEEEVAYKTLKVNTCYRSGKESQDESK